MKKLLWRVSQGGLIFTGSLTAKGVKDVIALNDGFILGAVTATDATFWTVLVCGVSFIGVALGLFMAETQTSKVPVKQQSK